MINSNNRLRCDSIAHGLLFNQLRDGWPYLQRLVGLVNIFLLEQNLAGVDLY